MVAKRLMSWFTEGGIHSPGEDFRRVEVGGKAFGSTAEAGMETACIAPANPIDLGLHSLGDARLTCEVGDFEAQVLLLSNELLRSPAGNGLLDSGAKFSSEEA